ncbi:hypothetical protein BY996DRAFT_6518406 [Phakopsora pachyrhizi]|nr:hypothetical protein BY996DRAFT_6518406 [Phakopsora pachyrhizi]
MTNSTPVIPRLLGAKLPPSSLRNKVSFNDLISSDNLDGLWSKNATKKKLIHRRNLQSVGLDRGFRSFSNLPPSPLSVNLADQASLILDGENPTSSGGRLRSISYSDELISPRLKPNQFKSPITDDEDELPKTPFDLLISKPTASEVYGDEDELGRMDLMNNAENVCEDLVIDASLQERYLSEGTFDVPLDLENIWSLDDLEAKENLGKRLRSSPKSSFELMISKFEKDSNILESQIGLKSISQPLGPEESFEQSIWFGSPPDEEEGLKQKQLKAGSKASSAKSSSLVNRPIKGFKSMTKLSSVVKNGSIRGKLKGTEVGMEGVDMEGVVIDQNEEIRLISQRLMQAIESSSEEEMMSPRRLYGQRQAIRENGNWNSRIEEEHLVRIENQVSINENSHRPGQKGDTKEWLKEQYSFEESFDEEELKEIEDYRAKRRLQRKKKKISLKNSAEPSTAEVEEKGRKMMLMRGKSIGRTIEGSLKNRMDEVKPDGNQVYHYSLKSQTNKQSNDPINHHSQAKSISSSSQSNWKMRFDQLKENMMSGLGIQSNQI